MTKKELFNEIDELIDLLKNPIAFTTYDRAIYQMDGLLLSLMSKNNETYKNFIKIVSLNNTEYVYKANMLVGVLKGLKNSIEISQNKRYQVFISSTYKDLIKYRIAALNAVIFGNNIPAGMEDFKASHINPAEYIKNVIDCSDYYVLIIGQRFGSIQDAATNTSFTMMEYNYAMERGMIVIPFIYNGKEVLPDNDLYYNRSLLDNFKSTVSIKHTPAYFTNEYELQKMITQSLNDAIEKYPKSGWIKFD